MANILRESLCYGESVLASVDIEVSGAMVDVGSKHRAPPARRATLAPPKHALVTALRSAWSGRAR